MTIREERKLHWCPPAVLERRPSWALDSLARAFWVHRPAQPADRRNMVKSCPRTGRPVDERGVDAVLVEVNRHPTRRSVRTDSSKGSLSWATCRNQCCMICLYKS